MHVGILKIHLRLAGNFSLKGKRHLIRPAIDQIRNRFNVSVAEVEEQNSWQSAVIGISIASGDARMIQEISSHILDFINSGRFSFEVTGTEMEIIPF